MRFVAAPTAPRWPVYASRVVSPTAGLKVGVAADTRRGSCTHPISGPAPQLEAGTWHVPA